MDLEKLIQYLEDRIEECDQGIKEQDKQPVDDFTWPMKMNLSGIKYAYEDVLRRIKS